MLEGMNKPCRKPAWRRNQPAKRDGWTWRTINRQSGTQRLRFIIIIDPMCNWCFLQSQGQLIGCSEKRGWPRGTPYADYYWPLQIQSQTGWGDLPFVLSSTSWQARFQWWLAHSTWNVSARSRIVFSDECHLNWTPMTNVTVTWDAMDNNRFLT